MMDERKDARTDGQTDGRTWATLNALPHSTNSGGIKNTQAQWMTFADFLLYQLIKQNRKQIDSLKENKNGVNQKTGKSRISATTLKAV